ncbi:MAG: glycoside hydrolase family 99-like domain-containing protein [Neisseriaceae bacterium]
MVKLNLLKLLCNHKKLYKEYLRLCNRTWTLGENFLPYKKHNISEKQRSIVKNIALYLPQFHQVKENDQWWGKNFTEWNNVTKAVPQYYNHYQPHLPFDVGYYDLLNKNTLLQQIDIAKNYGIYGFCYYFYWFNGRRILEKPLDIILNNQDLDMPFCYFWANDSWVRTWHGFSDFEHGDQVLQQQEHNDQDDINVMEYLCKNVFKDERYIKIDNKPVFILYHIYLFKDIKKTTQVWRDVCKRNGFDDIFLINVMMPDLIDNDPISMGFNATMQFPPIATVQSQAKVTVLNPKFSGKTYCYNSVVHSEINRTFSHQNVIRGCFMSWDNEARRPFKGTSYIGSTPEEFHHYLSGMNQFASKNKISGESLVFINAWNEWAEGAHLEPDREYGYSWLEVVAKIINNN